MKKLLLVLLSLGLMVSLSMSALAVDVKFSGEYYAAGMYLDKTSLIKDTGPSTAFYYQRLRLKTTFIVHPGLFLMTRADIMERAWGASRSLPDTTLDTLSSGTVAENENIAFDYAYLTYVSPLGMLMVGIMPDSTWGTVFGNNEGPLAKIQYIKQVGPIQFLAYISKATELSRTAKNPAEAADRDDSGYLAAVSYLGKNLQAGLLGKYSRNAGNRDLFGFLVKDTGYKTDVFVLLPYVKAKLGPVALQAEIIYLYGKLKWEGSPALLGVQDVDMNEFSGWIDATADFGAFYAGGSFAYMAGDDFSTTDKIEGGLTGGRDWNPCLIMFNSDLDYWAGSQAGYSGTANRAPMSNAYFLQARAGVRPVEKLDIMASVSWAHADKTLSAQWDSRDYGYEVDLTATYKITNNLSYMLGGGYFFVGDWYKGSTVGSDVSDNFLVINKLALTF